MIKYINLKRNIVKLVCKMIKISNMEHLTLCCSKDHRKSKILGMISNNFKCLISVIISQKILMLACNQEHILQNVHVNLHMVGELVFMEQKVFLSKRLKNES